MTLDMVVLGLGPGRGGRGRYTSDGGRTHWVLTEYWRCPSIPSREVEEEVTGASMRTRTR